MNRLGIMMVCMMLIGALTACTEKASQKMEWELETPKGWVPAQVPGTLLGTLTVQGMEPEALTAEDYAKIDKKQFEKVGVIALRSICLH